MLCEKCKKNQAKINLVKVVNGQKQQIWLCEECAKNISSIPFFSSIGEGAEFPFQDIISGILSTVDNKVQKEAEVLICHTCGLTIKEFNKTNQLGCADCYKVFKNEIKNKIQKNKLAIKHIGRIPKVNGKELIQRNRLKDLKYQLQILINKEEYEKAAVVCDEIKKIELYIIKSNIRGDESNLGGKKCNEELDS